MLKKIIISNIIPPKKDAYIVGGSIRDLLLGRSPTDYDIAVLGDPEKFAKKIAANTRGHIVELGKPGKMIIRVISSDHIFDIAPLNGASIEEDLNKRDFTINALAYALSSGKIIDCQGGIQDLFDKKVRMVSRAVFRKDPVRLIRAYRIGAFLNFEIESQTGAAIKNDSKLIQDSAGERVKAELFKMLGSPKSHHYLSQMADTELLFKIFPELVILKGCSQNKNHHYDVFEHTMKAYHHLETILNDYSKLLPDTFGQVVQTIDKNKSTLLKCAILFHDIGKPLARTKDSKGNVHFYGHDHKGAEMAKKISARLKFSNNETSYLDFIIRNHTRLLHLFIAHKKNMLTRKAVTRFFIKCGDNIPDLLLHFIADIKGKETESNTAFIDFTKNMMHDFFSSFKPLKSKPPLITGYDLIELGLIPSPLFKELLNRVEEARLSNKIKTRKAALTLVKNFLK